ncbi:MAG: tryptophan synthase subunit alpha [Gammaproteobacteria bacterium]|nr:tryptophan synthase subunit alpha [Gammaproteobacteria bacterium]MCP5201627.1 tryptophan synthase subunit alpha [Gammaproteobacteria bacterium]
MANTSAATAPTRIAARFDALAAQGRKGLITFITAGDPSVAATPAYMHALVRGGADIIELGVPFSDPMADGEVIQRASERALAHGTSLDDVLACVGEFRREDSDTPVVLMGYLNPFEHMGAARFAERAAAAGVDGALVVDLPPEEAADFNAALRAAGLDQVFLVAPNSPERRIRTVCAAASGFVYFVSVKGVTGDKAAAIDEIGQRVAMTRAFAGLPVGIGFGIRTPAAAAAAAAVADAVIVGSAIVEIIERGGDAAAVAAAVEAYVASLRQGIDGERRSR